MDRHDSWCLSISIIKAYKVGGHENEKGYRKIL